MPAPDAWNWQPGRRPPLSLDALVAGAELIELSPSPDGSRLAAVVADEDGMRLRVAGPGPDEIAQWPESYERIRQLRWSSDGRLAAIVGQDDEWTVVEDGEGWPESFEFVWDLRSHGALHTTASIKTDEGYTMAAGGKLWDARFPMIRESCLAANAPALACTVQVEAKAEADIDAFAAGLWSLAVNGQVWERRFVNAWEPTLAADGARAAALVRLSRIEHTVAVDGEPWARAFDCAWGPVFTPDGAVIAPVKADGGWTLARDGHLIWTERFVQLWRQRVAADGRVAAVVAPEFGRWTLICDGRPWSATWGEWVGSPAMAPGDDARLAAAVKDSGRWTVAVDGKAWKLEASRMTDPVFAASGGALVAVMERDDRWRLVVDGHPVGAAWRKLWPLALHADGSCVLLRGIDEDGQYLSQVIDLAAERSAS